MRVHVRQHGLRGLRCIFCREVIAAVGAECQGCGVALHATCRRLACPTAGCPESRPRSVRGAVLAVALGMGVSLIAYFAGLAIPIRAIEGLFLALGEHPRCSDPACREELMALVGAVAMTAPLSVLAFVGGRAAFRWMRTRGVVGAPAVSR